jgi:TRAP-type C4-dicarboxylate transport system permease small subunit
MARSPSALKKLVERSASFHDGVMRLLAMAAAGLVIVLVALLSYEVFMRYVFHRPPAWAWEVCESMVFLIAFLGAGWLLKKNGHVSVDIVFSFLSPNVKLATEALTSLLGGVMCLILTWAGVEIAIDHTRSGITVPGYLDIPKGPLLVFIPLGCLLLSTEFFRKAYGAFVRWRKPSRGPVVEREKAS